MAGRPRGVADDAILRAAVEVIGREGPAGFTLAAVAGEVGLVPGTVVQRFGSKRGLLLALAEASVREAGAVAARARADQGSALAALDALLAGAAEAVGTPLRYANHLAFLCADLIDPELHRHALAVHRAQGTAVRDLLAEAVARGELRADTDTAALAARVQTVVAGTGLTWALEREGTLAGRLRREIAVLLAPHAGRVPHASDAPQVPHAAARGGQEEDV